MRIFFQLTIFDVFYFSFIKQRKQNEITARITLPVIPEAPPPSAAVVVIPDDADVDDAVPDPVMSGIKIW